MLFLIKILLLFRIIVYILSEEIGKSKGAYIKTPEIQSLQYRLGNSLGYYGFGWNESKLSNLSRFAGYDTQKKRLMEFHLNNWGYDIELEDCKNNKNFEILDVVGYLGYPSKEHSSNAKGNSEYYYPKNLYEPIWLDDDKINPYNYWANYVNKTISIYKDYIKIWEIWDKPDFTENYINIQKWATEPPNSTDLSHWHGTIFEYIRLIRIAYEVAKKIDPNCWIVLGGLRYPQFLDAIMRYSDNPDNGKITEEYPAFGGAYFDGISNHMYPEDNLPSLELDSKYNKNGSDILSEKIVILKDLHYNVTKKYEFDGIKYPKKLFINTETGINSGESQEVDLLRRNWILKLALYSIEYDIRQIHMPYLADNNGGMGDFDKLGKFISVEEGSKSLKNSSKGRNILKKINLGKFIFDEKNTQKFRKSLPKGMTGIALKRNFEKEKNEKYYYKYLYSVWLYCEDEEITENQEIEIDIPFDPLVIDWEGNEKKKNKKIKVSSTPIFLLGGEDMDKDDEGGDEDDDTNGFVIFLEVLGVLLLIAVLIGFGLYVYKRYLTKKSLDIDNENLNEGLTSN